MSKKIKVIPTKESKYQLGFESLSGKITTINTVECNKYTVIQTQDTEDDENYTTIHFVLKMKGESFAKMLIREGIDRENVDWILEGHPKDVTYHIIKQSGTFFLNEDDSEDDETLR